MQFAKKETDIKRRPKMAKTNKTLKLSVYSRKHNTKEGRKFTTFSTKMNLPVINEDGTQTIQTKYIDLRFVKDAREKSKEIKRGFITVDALKISVPSKYEIKTDKDGKKVYPVVLVYDYIHYDEVLWTPSQDSFVVADEKDTEQSEVNDLPF